MDPERRTTWLLFDRDCRVCSAAARWARALDLRGHLQIRPIQESQDLLGDMPIEAALGAVHAVAPDGRVTEGAEALPLLLSAVAGVPRLEPLLRRSPPAMSTLSRTYDLLVEIRGKLTCGVGAASQEAHTPR